MQNKENALLKTVGEENKEILLICERKQSRVISPK